MCELLQNNPVILKSPSGFGHDAAIASVSLVVGLMFPKSKHLVM
jgi:hypothetical protein